MILGFERCGSRNSSSIISASKTSASRISSSSGSISMGDSSSSSSRMRTSPSSSDSISRATKSAFFPLMVKPNSLSRTFNSATVRAESSSSSMSHPHRGWQRLPLSTSSLDVMANNTFWAGFTHSAWRRSVLVSNRHQVVARQSMLMLNCQLLQALL